MKYAWITQHQDSFPLTLMCKLLHVSRSGYYASLARPVSLLATRTAKIHAAVRQVFEESHMTYGPQKITHELGKRAELQAACRNTVGKAMRELGLKSRVKRAFTPTTTKTDPTKQPAANVLARQFTATRPNEKWVTDITYLPTEESWVYLAVVIDLFSRKVVGWQVSESLATPLVSEALRQAVESRRPQRGQLLHHSDRGSQYTSESYQQTLQTLGIECSMSRRGNCYDNAVAERFFWSLKHEWTKHHEYANLESARLSVFKYIEVFYNRQRLHQSLGYKTPEEFEADHAPAQAA